MLAGRAGPRPAGAAPRAHACLAGVLLPGKRAGFVLTGWLAGWLAGWLVSREWSEVLAGVLLPSKRARFLLMGWLASWLAGWLADWLTG